jgi:acyl-CoA synthetase (AMP-forming)/AMP-acid ligase II
VTVPLDVTRDTIDRKIYKLKLTKAKVLLTQKDEATKKENRQIIKKIPDLRIIEVGSFNELKIAGEKIDWSVNDNLNDDCLILFTSGTTADPKGARLTPKSLMANAVSIADWLKFKESERFYVLLPLHHINSTTFVNTTLLSGGTVILTPKYSKSRFWEMLAKHRVTGSSIVPTIAYDLLTETKSFNQHKNGLRQVLRIQLGSAPVQPKVVNEFMVKFEIPLVQGYGQTETSLRSTGVPMDMTKKQVEDVRRLNSVGTELTYTNVTVLNKEGEEVKESEEGEICIRGPVIMQGYLSNKKATEEAFAYGWFHSGDTGYFKKMYGRRFFFLKGREKEIIKKGGVLISPLAIENTLLEKYPKLKKLYIVGFSDERMGEEIGAVVTAGKKAFEEFDNDVVLARVRGLKPFEFPRSALRVIDSHLPTTSTGKIQRVRIKELYQDKLGDKSKTISETVDHKFRLLGEEDKSLIAQAVKIHNHRWGEPLGTTVEILSLAAKNGLLIGAINRRGEVDGSVQAVIVDGSEIDKIVRKDHWASTWKGITGNGTLETNNRVGDSLVCVSISVRSNDKYKKERAVKEGRQKLTAKKLMEYLKSDKDSVVRFHRKAKGGFGKGARLLTVIAGGRKEDKSALGYNLLVEYPKLTMKPKIGTNQSVGSQLIEAAMIWAYNQKLKRVLAYTRPADLGVYFVEN